MSSNAEPIRRITKVPFDYDKFRAIADRYGWKLVRSEDTKPNHPLFHQEVFTDAAEVVELYYIEDDLAGVVYLAAGGPKANEVLGILERELPLFSDAELLASFDQARSDEEVAHAVLRLGVASMKEADPEFVRRFAQALNGEHAGVRSATLVAVSYRCWDELKPLIQDLFDRETAEEPKRRAGRILERWEQRIP